MIARLLEHLIWADERTARALATLPAPDAELLKLHAHILGAQTVWLARIVGRSPAVSPWPDLSMGECDALMAANHTALRHWISAADPADLERVISYTNTKGESFASRLADILHHVVLHGMYHRGQIMQGVRRAGGTPLATDFIVFARGK